MKSLKIFFISAYQAMETCHYPVFVIRQQKEGQIPAKLSFARNGSENVKMVETINLLLRAMKRFNFAKFQSRWNRDKEDKNLNKVTKFCSNSYNKAEKKLVGTKTIFILVIAH